MTRRRFKGYARHVRSVRIALGLTTQAKPARNPKGSYQRRDVILAEMNFSSYRDYLRSDLWKDIRSRVIGPYTFCKACRQRPASEVHHLRYDKDTMLGRRVDTLMALCHDCHDRIEFGRKGKRSLNDANMALLGLVSKVEKQRIQGVLAGGKKPKRRKKKLVRVGTHGRTHQDSYWTLNPTFIRRT